MGADVGTGHVSVGVLAQKCATWWGTQWNDVHAVHEALPQTELSTRSLDDGGAAPCQYSPFHR